MRPVTPVRLSVSAELQAYDDLRHARPGELRHHDEAGLRLLFDDYFGDPSPDRGELERVSKPPRAA